MNIYQHQEINQIKNPSSNKLVNEDEVENKVMEIEVKLATKNNKSRNIGRRNVYIEK